MQTTISLQEEPRGKDDAFAVEPRAQTGLRGGKLGRSMPESLLQRSKLPQPIDPEA